MQDTFDKYRVPLAVAMLAIQEVDRQPSWIITICIYSMVANFVPYVLSYVRLLHRITSCLYLPYMVVQLQEQGGTV